MCYNTLYLFDKLYFSDTVVGDKIVHRKICVEGNKIATGYDPIFEFPIYYYIKHYNDLVSQ